MYVKLNSLLLGSCTVGLTVIGARIVKDNFNNTSSGEQEKNNNNSEHDSILGSILFDCFCGAALGELAAEAMDVPMWARELDLNNALDLYEEYRRDRANGGFKLGVNGALNGKFNGLGTIFDLGDKPDSPSLPAYDVAARGQGSFVTTPAPALH